MALFNKRTLNKALQDIAPVPADHAEILARWAATIADRSIEAENETQIEGDFKSRIVETVLGYTPAGLDAEQTVAAKEPIGGGEMDLALGHFSADERKIIAPFELKGAKTRDLDAPMPGRKESPVQQAWRYAMRNRGSRWVLVTNYVELRLYSYADGDQDYELFRFEDLTDRKEYARFHLLLCAENLLGNRTRDLLTASREADREIGEDLYADYKALRQELIAAIPAHNPHIDAVAAVGAAQTVLDRVLFVAFAEDTRLLPANSLKKAFEHEDPYNQHPVWQNFRGLFRAIDQGNKQLNIPKYNGGLFQSDPLVDEIDLPDEVCEGFKRIGDYDYETEVGVTILGHIFEQSISDLERLLARARGDIAEEPKKTGTSGRRKRDGIVYTPDYIARFIVERTLGAHVEKLFRATMAEYAKGDPADYDSLTFSRGGKRGDPKWNERELAAWTDYRFRLQTLRVVDPACGSGVFLVTAFDWLKAEYDRVNAKMEELRGSRTLFDPDGEILSQNLYGVDVNAESVEITKLSLWLKTARYGKELASLDHTIRVGDSLIEDSNFAYLEHGFSWNKAFPEVFATGGFDVVLGNPPYVRMELIKPMKPYLEKRFEVVSDRADLYCYFYERGLRLLKDGGRLGYISSSTFFKTGSGKPLRRYLLKEAALETVTDFGDLQIFEGVTTYPVIMTMRREAPVDDHNLHFWKLDAVPRDNFSQAFHAHAEPFPQSALGAGSWELESPALRRLREKVVAGKPTLKEVYGRPQAGIKTGYNSAFIVTDSERQELIARDPRLSVLVKPYLLGGDVFKWHTPDSGVWIVYIPKNTIQIQDFPLLEQFLEPHKRRLIARAADQDWFELQQSQYRFSADFEMGKIVYKDISDRPCFALDLDGKFIDMTCFAIPRVDLVLLALLNSNCFWFALTAITTIARGGFYRMKTQYVETLPIPPASDADKAELSRLAEACQTAAEARYALQQAVRRRIPDLCPPDHPKVKRQADGAPKLTNRLKDWWQLADFAQFRAEIKKTFKADIPLSERSDWEDWLKTEKAEIARLSAEITRNEAQINAIVYRLFELTDEEIQLLEANI